MTGRVLPQDGGLPQANYAAQRQRCAALEKKPRPYQHAYKSRPWKGRRSRTHGRSRASTSRQARRAGIDKRVHAHGLRHTHAAQLRAEGVDIGIISKQLGHRSIATTARYLDHIAPQQVIDTIRQRTWQPQAVA